MVLGWKASYSMKCESLSLKSKELFATERNVFVVLGNLGNLKPPFEENQRLPQTSELVRYGREKLGTRDPALGNSTGANPPCNLVIGTILHCKNYRASLEQFLDDSVKLQDLLPATSNFKALQHRSRLRCWKSDPSPASPIAQIMMGCGSLVVRRIFLGKSVKMINRSFACVFFTFYYI